MSAVSMRKVCGLFGFDGYACSSKEPGREDKETIATGSQAAAAGGFTAVACMPNTTPALDEESKIRYVIQRVKLVRAESFR